MDDLRENLDKMVKDTSVPKSEIEKLVFQKMTSFMQMIEKNDVQEADLSNFDNKLYQKLIDRSKSCMPGDDLKSPDALYRFEQLATQLLQ
jgi:hypothetical protein